MAVTMSADPRVARLVEQLFGARPGQQRLRVYGAFDGASDRRIHPMLLSTLAEGEDYRSLYSRAPRELARVAPYLVRLDTTSPMLALLAGQGWGRNWCSLLRTEASLEDVHEHLRQFVNVQTEAGKELLFRFYDPRVLRVYLPTCTEEELARFFGPVREYLVEDRGGGGVTRYRCTDGRLEATSIDLGAGG